MKLLLDTNALIWWHQHSGRFGAKARASVMGASEVCVSVISGWEIAVKAGLGKLNLKGDFTSIVEHYGFRQLSLTFMHIRNYENLQPIHKDPFDRLLIMQALSEGLIFLSSDKMLQKYPVPFINARE